MIPSVTGFLTGWLANNPGKYVSYDDDDDDDNNVLLIKHSYKHSKRLYNNSPCDVYYNRKPFTKHDMLAWYRSR